MVNWTSFRAILVPNHTCDFKTNSFCAFVLKSRASFQTKLHSTQFNYLYQSDYINQFCSNVILFLFFSNCIVFKLEKRVPVVFIPEFCTTAWARGLLDRGRIHLKVGCCTWKSQVSQDFMCYFLFMQLLRYYSSYELSELTQLFDFDLR